MKRLLHIKLRLLLGACVGGLVALVFWVGGMTRLEEMSVDWRLRLRGPQAVSDDVRLVGIGDRDVGSVLGRWPFPRGVHADVLDILGAMGARHTTFDVLFTEPSADPAQDARFLAAIQRHSNTTLGYYFDDTGHGAASGPPPAFTEGNHYGLKVSERDFIGAANAPPPFSKMAGSFGAANVMPDGDGFIRRVPLFFDNNGKLYPSLAMQTLISFLGLRPDQIQIEPGKEITLANTPRGTLKIPIDSQGQYRVNLAGDISVFDPAFQYIDLYEGVQTPEVGTRITQAVKGRVVFVGLASTGNTDMVNTSVGRIPGVVVQAMVVSNVLSGRHLRSLSPWSQVLLLIGAGALLGMIMIPSRPWLALGAFALVAVGWSAAALAAAYHDWILPAVPTLTTLGFSTLVLTGLEAAAMKRDRSRIVSVLGKYLARPLLQMLVDTAENVSSTSERKVLTVFFSDIRGFTSWTERTEPEEVTKCLNEYFSAMTPIVEKHGGTLDKFIGDCVMVFFGAPVFVPDHPLRAVRMAWDMQREVDRLNEKWARESRESLHVGIGIHTANVTVGNFGSASFLDYTVIGRGVNLAARIESYAPAGKILLSGQTQQLAGDTVVSRPFAELMLKGIPDPVLAYEVLSVAGLATPPFAPTPAEWWLVEGEKRTGPFPQEGIAVMRQCGRLSGGAVVEQVPGSRS